MSFETVALFSIRKLNSCPYMSVLEYPGPYFLFLFFFLPVVAL